MRSPPPSPSLNNANYIDQLALLEAALSASEDGKLLWFGDELNANLSNAKFRQGFGLEESKLAEMSVLDLTSHVQKLIQNPEVLPIPDLTQYDKPLSLFDEILRMKDGRLIRLRIAALENGKSSFGQKWSIRDVTTFERNQSLDKIRLSSMTKIALAAPLRDILDSIAKGVELSNPNFRCIILVLDNARRHVTLCTSPSLPPSMTRKLEGAELTKDVGSCGLAIATNQKVILHNIEKHPAFAGLQEVVKASGGKSAWSEPIHDGQGGSIGTFAIFYHSQLEPTAADEIVMRDAVALAAAAIKRRREEERTKAQELRFRTVFEGSNDAIILGSKESVIDCNQRAWQMFELDDKAELLKSRLLDHSPEFQANGETSAKLAREYTQAVIKNGMIKFDWLHKTKSGRIFPTDVIISTYIAEGRRVSQFTIRDISDRYIAQKALDEERQKLVAAAKMSSLGEMAGGVAHEINNPLTIILGHAAKLRKRIERGTLDLDSLSEELVKIENTALRIAKIIKGLRSFSRNAEDDPFETYSLNQIMDETLELCQERIRNHAIELIVAQPVEALILCRPGQISQVLLNLLSNASDAIEYKENAWIKVESRLDLEKREVTISVTDSGQGIDEKILDKLMQPFFTTKEVGKGTGLGLSISRGITKDHGGSLAYDASSPHTRFLLTLPLAP